MKKFLFVISIMAYGLITSQISGSARNRTPEISTTKFLEDTRQQIDTIGVADSLSLMSRNTESYSTFSSKQLILPGVLIAVGTFGVYNGAFHKINDDIKTGMNNLSGDHYFHADDYIQYVPALTYLTFGSIGIKSKHSFKERVVVEATAYMFMTAFTNIGKYTFKEKRPNSNARNSFPSGHTATVFTGAELMRSEYGLGIGIGAYTIATGVAFLRLYNGRHWLNDIIAGAALGILSARIGLWMLPLYQRWFKWNNNSKKIVVVTPGYNVMNQSIGINIVYNF
ncbi:MAG: phosphatase PAP2 family protein [Muribaculaceae bacterium]|nr:phosphatase PAP2 family protein [Muribaculaceae bacterium]